MTRNVSRRGFLAGAGGLGLAGLLSGCSSPAFSSFTGSQPDSSDVIFWNLFSGGDGANMKAMIDAFRRDHPGVSVESTTLSWGNPYYTKLALATASGRTPDVAVAHLSRLPLLARAGLLEPLTDLDVERVGITKDQFTPAAWTKATVDGVTYAVPLDTHPFVMFYNVDLAKKAGVLDGDRLAAASGRDEFVSLLGELRKASGGYGAVMSTTADPSTCWRFFSMIYGGLAGPIVADIGTKVTLDPEATRDAFAFMQQLTAGNKLLSGNLTSAGVTSSFGTAKSGFLFDGEWQVPTYRGVKLGNGKPLNFDVVPFPALLGTKPVAYADSHALVVPRNADRGETRTRNAVSFIRGMLDHSDIWAEGGHIPAWLKVQRSKKFRAEKPQSNYTQAAFDAIYDPPGWYTGAGSNFQTAMGQVIAQVLGHGTTPADGASQMRARLDKLAAARPPVR